MFNSFFYVRNFNNLRTSLSVLQTNIRSFKFSIKTLGDKISDKSSSLNKIYISVLDYNNNDRWRKGKYVVYWPSYPQYNAIGNGLHTKIYHNGSDRYYLCGLIYVMIKAIYNLNLDRILIVTGERYLKSVINKKLDIFEKNYFIQYCEGIQEKRRNADLFKIICMLRKKIKLSCIVENFVDSNQRNIPAMEVVKYYNNTLLNKEETIKRYENLVNGKRNLWYYLDDEMKEVYSRTSYPIFDEPHFKADLKNTTKNAPIYYVTGSLIKKNPDGYLTKFVFQSFKDRICVAQPVVQNQLNISLIKLIGIINCLETAISLGLEEIIIVHDINFFSYGIRHGWVNINGEEIGFKDEYYQIVELSSKINVDFVYYDIINGTPSFSFFKTLSAAFYGDDFDRYKFQ